MRIKWLHISDIHFAYAGYDTGLARKDLLSCLHKIGENEMFTDIFVTGDVLYRNKEDADNTISFLNEVVASVGVTKEHVWIVPGNHDHCRETCGDIYSKIYKAKDPSLAVDELADDEIDNLVNAFEYYKNFLDLFYGEERTYDERKMHWHAKLQGNCSVVGVNTAWLEKDTCKKPYVRIGLKNLLDVFSSINLENKDMCIAIGHHPIGTLWKGEQERILDLFRRNNVQIYLCGHEHGASVKYYEDAGVVQIDAAGLLVDGFSYGGFCIGTVDTDNDIQKVEFFKWNKSAEHWGPDGERVGVSIDGVSRFERVRKRQGPSNVAIDAKLLNGPIPDQEIYDALQDSNVDIVRFQTTNVTGPISAERWKILRAELFEVKRTTDGLWPGKNLSIFPLAPIPLLVEMGYLYQRDTPVSIWQHHRNRSKWIQNDRDDVDNELKKECNIQKKSGKLIVAIGTSSNIFTSQIEGVLSTSENDIIRFYTSDPQVGCPHDTGLVKQFAYDISRELLTTVGQYDEVHFFIATPAGLALEIGRGIQRNMFPVVHLYHYQAGYHYAYEINGASLL